MKTFNTRKEERFRKCNQQTPLLPKRIWRVHRTTTQNGSFEALSQLHHPINRTTITKCKHPTFRSGHRVTIFSVKSEIISSHPTQVSTKPISKTPYCLSSHFHTTSNFFHQQFSCEGKIAFLFELSRVAEDFLMSLNGSVERSWCNTFSLSLSTRKPLADWFCSTERQQRPETFVASSLWNIHLYCIHFNSTKVKLFFKSRYKVSSYDIFAEKLT